MVSVKLNILLQNDKFHPVHVFPSKNMDIKTTGRKEKQNHPDRMVGQWTAHRK